MSLIFDSIISNRTSFALHLGVIDLSDLFKRFSC